MNYTEQLQTLPKEDATQVIFDVMNARAIEALEAMKNEVSEGNFYRMGDMINGSMPWDSAKLPKDTSKHSYTRYSNDVPVEVKPHNGQDRVWNYKTNEMMSIGKPQKSWDGKRNLTPYTGKLVGSEVSEGTTDGAYSDKHPKIDLFHNGVYIASTNWSSTVKHAVAKAKEKRPELTGKMTGKISVRESIAESINVAEFYQNSIDESIKKVGEFFPPIIISLKL